LNSRSVWGGGNTPEYVRKWRATDNGLEAIAAAHCDTLLLLDEIGQATSETVGAVAYMLASGAGKSRAGRHGEGRAPAEWRCLFLSTGEISIADKLAEDGRTRRLMAGQAVRIVDLPADPGAGHGCFAAWLASRGGIGSAEELEAVGNVRRYLEQYGSLRFELMRPPIDPEMPLQPSSDRALHHRVGYREQTKDGETIFHVLLESWPEFAAGSTSGWRRGRSRLAAC
jgi:uncharacterized protein (DUF927 family)